MKRNRLIPAFCAALLMSCALEGQAQLAASFEQLQVLVRPGDTVHVTDTQGNLSKGKITGLTNSSLKLLANGSAREFSQSDVFEIKQWRHDSLKNGALIGAGVGFGLTLAAAIALCEWGCDAGEVVAVTAVYTGIGAGIGVGIDALIPSKQTIYHGGIRNSLSKLRFQPLLGRSRKGVAMSFQF